MRPAVFALVSIPALLAAVALGQPPAAKAVLVVHGGAGVEGRKEMTPEVEKQYRSDVERALKAGHAAMSKPGGTSLDGVVAAINVLEDAPFFNAGKGAVFNREGRNELNASIMEGKDRRAGAVAGVNRIKNPISAARLVMEKSDHVFLIGGGAERFARSQGLEEVTPLYFWTERTWKQLQDAQERERKKANKQAAGDAEYTHFGTVGAVAVDSAGNLAAGTSTGGIMNKMPGRVGDSPIIGAGTYADNAACAVSCTGHGEFYIRHAVAHDIVARMKYGKAPVGQAAKDVLDALPKRPGGIGGIIAIDAAGTPVMLYNTNGMPRGYVTAEGKVEVMIYEK